MPRPSTTAQASAPDRCASALLSLMMTVLLLTFLHRTASIAAPEGPPVRLSLRFIALQPPQPVETLPVAPRVAKQRSTTPTASTAQPRSAGHRDNITATAARQVALLQPVPAPQAPPVQTALPQDSWNASPPPAASTQFRRDFLRREEPTLKASQPGRFQMKRQITPQDIVRGASQILGFWPPGYTDDPCGGIRRSVQQLSSASTTHEKAQLADAVQLQQTYCQ